MDKYNVIGMTCSACSARVEKAVSNVEGVTSCQVNLLTNSMMVDGTADSGTIVAAVEKAGYGASLAGGRSAGGNTSHSGGKSSGSGESEADKEFGKMFSKQSGILPRSFYKKTVLMLTRSGITRGLGLSLLLLEMLTVTGIIRKRMSIGLNTLYA